jgi:type VI secretion system protein ImpM
MTGVGGPGFYGKLPSAGDFVSRGLPASFCAAWDRWLSRHLARLPEGAPAIHFRRDGFSGVVLPSRDSAGRRFPLTVAIAGAPPDEALAALGRHGAAAIAGALTADVLAARLAAAPVAAEQTEPAPPDAFLLWIPPDPPRAVDPDDPAPALAALSGEEA